MFGGKTNPSGASLRAPQAASGAPIRAVGGRGANLTQSGPNRLVTPAGFVPYAGDGYALLLPGKWNPSKEREFAGMDVRCAARERLGSRAVN